MNRFKELVSTVCPPHGSPRLFTGMPLYWTKNNKGFYIVVSPNSHYKAVSFGNFLNGYHNADKVCDSYFMPENSWIIPGNGIEMNSVEQGNWCRTLEILRNNNPLFATVYDKYYGYLLENGVWKKNSGWFEGGLPVPEDLAALVFNSQISQLTLKQQNTDGRLNCARCNGKIKVLKGFDMSYNHCPVCEP